MMLSKSIQQEIIKKLLSNIHLHNIYYYHSSVVSIKKSISKVTVKKTEK